MAEATMAGINALARSIAENFYPQKIILFGSYSRGTQTYDSDVDFLVIMQTDVSNTDQALAIAKALPRPFPIDIVVYRPEDVERRLAGGDTVLADILEEGVVLYEVRHERVGGKGRG